jgi:hypothetical protein
MSSTVFAAGADINGFVSSAFGQYTTGAKDYTAHFLNTYLGVLDVNAKSDKFFGGAEIDVIGPPGTPNTGPALAVSNIRAGWMLSDTVSLIVGEIDPGPGKGYARGAGTFIPFMDSAWWGPGEYVRAQVNGLWVNAKVSGFDIYVGLLDAARRGDAQGSGSGNAILAEGAIGPLGVKLAVESGTVDDFANPNDDALSKSSNLLGVKYSISDMMSISLDVSARTTAVTKDVNTVEASNAIQFVGKKLGPGDLTFTYGSAKTDPSDKTDKDDWTDAYTNIVYSYDVGDPSGKVNFMYLSKATSYADSAKDAVTASYIGIGLVKFF